jgi:transcriptional regulator with XRE-family HTH domain
MVNAVVNMLADKVTPEGCRAARGWLGWSLAQTAKVSGIALDTISRYERGAKGVSERTREALYQAFAERGIEVRRDGLQVRRQDETAVGDQ